MNILFNHYVILALHIAHVAGGVLWAESAIIYLFVLLPAARLSGSAGQTFMQNFGPRFAKQMPVVSTVTIVSGALLYARLFAGGIDWIWTAGGPPQPEQITEMNHLQTYALQNYRADFALVAIAMVAMAIARYV